jgi:hypothetical protein
LRDKAGNRRKQQTDLTGKLQPINVGFLYASITVAEPRLRSRLDANRIEFSGSTGHDVLSVANALNGVVDKRS